VRGRLASTALRCTSGPVLAVLWITLCASAAAAADLDRDFSTATIEQLLDAIKRGNSARIDDEATYYLVKRLSDPGAAAERRAVEAALASKNSDLRDAAAYALGSAGSVAAAAAPALVRALRDPDSDVRWSAAEALSRIQPDPKIAVPALLQSLDDPHEQESVREGAAEALGGMGPDGAPAVSALTKALSDRHARMRDFAAASLGNIGPAAKSAVPALLTLLKGPDAGVRASAAEALGQIRSGKETVVPGLTEALQDPSAGVRGNAAYALGYFGADAQSAIPALAHALSDPDTDLRVNAASVLANIEDLDLAGAALPGLEGALKDADPMVRQYAAIAVARLGPDAKTALPELLTTLTDERPETREASARALGNFGMEARMAAPALARAASDPNPLVRRTALEALGAVSPPEELRRSAFRSALNDPDPSVRQVAVMLVPLGGELEPEVMEALLKLLKDRNGSVRSAAANLLRNAPTTSPLVASALAEALKDPDPNVRRDAALALANGPEALQAMPVLTQLLGSGDDETRMRVATALETLRDHDVAHAAIPALIRALHDPLPSVRLGAAAALSEMGHSANTAAPDLIDALNDPEVIVRIDAAMALGRIGANVDKAVSTLTTLMDSTDMNARLGAVRGLGAIGPEAKSAVPILLTVVKQAGDGTMQLAAVDTLGNIGPPAKPAVNALLELLHSKDPSLRAQVGTALANIAPENPAVISALVGALQDAPQEARLAFAYALSNAVRNAVVQHASGTYGSFGRAVDVLKKADDEQLQRLGAEMAPLVGLLRPSPSLAERIEKFISEHLISSIAILLYLGWTIFCLGLFWIWPLRALRLNERLAGLDYKLPSWAGGGTVPMRFALFIGFLGYLRPALDAWVASVVVTARERFALKTTVKEREVHVGLPVLIDGDSVLDLSAANLRPTFGRNLACLLIVGDGGAGKTSLACQIARWGMAEPGDQRLAGHLILPVLIEQELAFSNPGDGEGSDDEADKDKGGKDKGGKDKGKGGNTLLFEAIRRQLQDLIDAPSPPERPLVEALLRERRVMVLVDHFSEMGTATRRNIQPEAPSFPVNALVVTSRVKEPLGGVTKTTLEPMRIEGNRLSVFMDAYLKQREARDLFDDTAFFDLCKSLAMMVGDRKITALLAKLYAEQQILVRQDVAAVDLPGNIPDLMLTYLNRINRAVSEGRLGDERVREDAKTIAWMCVGSTGVPQAVARRDVVAALGDDARDHLEYYENRLNLVGAVEPDAVRFLLDPLAEYLAGIELTDRCGGDESEWAGFLALLDTPPFAQHNIRGFLLAIRDCCKAAARTMTIPPFVVPELEARAIPAHPADAANPIPALLGG